MSERVLSGASASPGLAIGRARVLSHPSEGSARDPGPTRAPEAEAEYALEALRQAAAALEQIAARLRDDGRPDEAEIVETGVLMAADPVLESTVSSAVTERGLSAAAALAEATEQHAAVIASLPDALLGAGGGRTVAGPARRPDRRRCPRRGCPERRRFHPRRR